MTNHTMTTRHHLDHRLLKRLLRQIWPFRWRAACVLVLIILANLDTVINSLYIGLLIDKYIQPMLASGSHDFTPLMLSLMTMSCIYLFGVVVSFLSEYLMIPVTQGVLKNIRDKMFVRLQHLPLEYFDNNKFGDIMSRFTNDTDTLEQMIGRSLPNVITSITMIIMVVITMIYQSFYLTLVAAGVIGVMMWVSAMILKRSGRYFVIHQKTLGDVNGLIEETISGQKVIKVFSHEREAIRDFTRLNDKLALNNQRANAYANVLMPIMINFGNLQYILIGIIGGIMAVNGWGGVSLGLIASFMYLSRNLSRPISMVSQQLNSIVVALAGASRIFALIDEQPEEDNGQITLVNAKKTHGQLQETRAHTGLWAWKKPDGQLVELEGDVRFEHVTFSYQPGKPVLNDVSFYAQPGQKIAFVGHTGAGKTTITNLLNRFYDIDAGTILYDGLDIKDIIKADLRRSLGIVLQETNLFTGSVRDNIAYGKPLADWSAIEAAAKTANADSFIQHLPQGYQTKLEGDGSDLSQGQRQLLAIARAALLDPPVMILDEATSSIDTRTERLIQEGMDNLMAGRTTLVIAHRLSTVRQARAIMVMDHGRIIESGSHEKLMKQKGVYYQLYTGAFELE